MFIIVLETKENFSRAMDRIYGQLMALDTVGRQRAERFFPRVDARRRGMNPPGYS